MKTLLHLFLCKSFLPFPNETHSDTVYLLLPIHIVSGGNVVTGLALTCAEQFSAYKTIYSYTASPLSCYVGIAYPQPVTEAVSMFVFIFTHFLDKRCCSVAQTCLARIQCCNVDVLPGWTPRLKLTQLARLRFVVDSLFIMAQYKPFCGYMKGCLIEVFKIQSSPVYRGVVITTLD